MLETPKCYLRRCQHLQGVIQPDGTEKSERPSCAAFPTGIPLEIAYGRNLHTKPFPGDHGIQYERQLTHNENELVGLNCGEVGCQWRQFVPVQELEAFAANADRPKPSLLGLKLLARYGRYTAYTVNGERVRDRSEHDEAFDDWAVHGKGPSELSLVPPNQIWLEDTLDATERHIALSMALHYLETQAHGKTANGAYSDALRLGSRERNLLLGNKGYDGQHLAGLYVEGPVHTPIGNEVWLVNGDVVRLTKSFKKPDFVLGGNGMAYNFIKPVTAIWLEQDVAISERIYILVHELTEWWYMYVHGWPYHKAHNLAERVEYHWRHSAAVPEITEMTGAWVEEQAKET